MPLPRFHRLPPERRAGLLDVAAQRFAAEGYDGASLNEILAAAGVGKSSYYYYFSDKEDLFATVVEAHFAAAFAAMPAPALDTSSADAWWASGAAFFSAWMGAYGDDPVAMGLRRALQALRRAPPPRLRAVFEQPRALYAGWIQQGQTLGFVRADLDTPLLVALLEAVDIALDDALLASPGLSQGEHAARVVDTWRRILAPGEVRRKA